MGRSPRQAAPAIPARSAPGPAGPHIQSEFPTPWRENRRSVQEGANSFSEDRENPRNTHFHLHLNSISTWSHHSLMFFFSQAYSISFPDARPTSKYCACSGEVATSTALLSLPRPNFIAGKSSLEGGSARKNPVFPLARRWLRMAGVAGL